MSVRMTHPDLEGAEIAVAPSAVPVHAESGWVEVPGQAEQGEVWPAELQRFEGQPPVRLRHPETGAEITVAESAVPFHRERGWLPVPEAEVGGEAAEAASEPTPARRRRRGQEQEAPAEAAGQTSEEA
ncbi:MAG TPA: hypothetical protein VIV12_14735 [Streptosporangiaceae bacterium]